MIDIAQLLQRGAQALLDGRAREAELLYRDAMTQSPASSDCLRGLAMALMNQRRVAEAIPFFEQRAHLAEANYAGRSPQTLDDASRGQWAEALMMLGVALCEEGQPAAAIKALRRAMHIDDRRPNIHVNLAMALLLDGQLKEGFAEYEWRLRANSPRQLPAIPKPMWDGSNLPQATLLLHGEQGMGDVIQFSRFVPMAAKRVGRVILACPQPLHRLLGPISNLVEVTDVLPALEKFDVHLPLLSLPRVFGTEMRSIPNQVPYLDADRPRVDHWRRILGPSTAKRRIGICWTGGAQNSRNAIRSIPPLELAALWQAPNVEFVSLQKGVCATDVLAGRPINDYSKHLHDLAETAALMQNLDLVITVDTVIAHLAGALGRPTWTLLARAADWRWFLDRDDSPWYPTMRLFRQQRHGLWEDVLRKVMAELSRVPDN